MCFNVIPVPHKLKDQPSNRWKKHTNEYEYIRQSFDLFFQKLEGEAENHSSWIIQKIIGNRIQDTDVDTVELPSWYNKRKLFVQYIYFHMDISSSQIQ